MTSHKNTDIAEFVSQHIAQRCQCQYPSSFIADGRLFCTTKDNIIYQAQLLPTDSKTALEIRNTTQLWVLSKPVLMIDGEPYQLDFQCSVVIEELGVTLCDTVGSTEPLPASRSTITLTEMISVIGTGILLLLVIIIMIILGLCCLRRKKSKHHTIR